MSSHSIVWISVIQSTMVFFAALLLRALFTDFIKTFQDSVHNTQQHLHHIRKKLSKANLTLQQASLTGPFPLLFGYYNSRTQVLLLLSAGLKVSLTLDGQASILCGGIPLGALQGVYPNWLSKHAQQWQCKIEGDGQCMQITLSDTNKF